MSHNHWENRQGHPLTRSPVHVMGSWVLTPTGCYVLNLPVKRGASPLTPQKIQTKRALCPHPGHQLCQAQGPH